MAKKSKIARDQQRREVVEGYAERREQLKRESVNPHLSPEVRERALAALHRLPRDASPTDSATATSRTAGLAAT